MRTRTGLYLFIMLIVVASSRSVLAKDGAVIDQVWLTKARGSIKSIHEKYKALCPRLEAECEYRYDKSPRSARTMTFQPHIRRERTIRLGDNMILEQLRILDGKPDQLQIRVQCDNSDYHFTLGRLKESSPYALTEYAPGKRKLPLVRQGRAQGWHNEGWSHLRDALAAMENDDKYNLRSLRFDETKGLLRMDFTNSAGNSLAEEQLSLDPGRDWRVVERRVETTSLVATNRWTYGVSVGGLEFPTDLKNHTTYKDANSLPNMEVTGRLISLKLTDKTPDDFRLSAFGLPEPADVPPPPKPTPWYLWLVAAAGVCAALSVSFAYVWRRRQARLAPAAVQGGKP